MEDIYQTVPQLAASPADFHSNMVDKENCGLKVETMSKK